MDGIQLRDEAVRDRVRAATEFLDPTDPRAESYRGKIVTMLNRGLRRLVVSIDDIRGHNRELADGLLHAPFDHAPAFDQALRNVVKTLPNRSQKETSDETVGTIDQSFELWLTRCSHIMWPTPAALERMLAIHGHWDQIC
jgi:DNA replication licensing factor MCM3